jgi:hypothetical protein
MGMKILTMAEPLDGMKFDFTVPMSQRFALGGSWTYSNKKPNKFDLTCALNSLSAGNPMN